MCSLPPLKLTWAAYLKQTTVKLVLCRHRIIHFWCRVVPALLNLSCLISELLAHHHEQVQTGAGESNGPSFFLLNWPFFDFQGNWY